MIHKKNIEKYNGNMDQLVEDIGNLHYEELENFLIKLGDKFIRDANKDLESGRENLAESLYKSSQSIFNTANHIRISKEICEPYND